MPREQLPPSPTSTSGKECLFICSLAYGIVTEYLRNVRDRAKCQFFINCGFLFENWELCGLLGDNHRLPYVSFTHVMTSDPEPTSVKDCSVAVTESSSVDKGNNTLLRELYNKHDEFIIEAEYEVFVAEIVYKGGRLRKGDVPVKKLIHRAFNILEVALHFCMAYCSRETKESFLRSHAASLRTVYRIATVLRELVEARVEAGLGYMGGNNGNPSEKDVATGARDSTVNGDEGDIEGQHQDGIENRQVSSSFHEGEDEPEPGKKCSRSKITWEDLIPVKSSRKSILETKVLRIDKKAYEEMHNPPRLIDPGDDNRNQASEDLEYSESSDDDVDLENMRNM